MPTFWERCGGLTSCASRLRVAGVRVLVSFERCMHSVLNAAGRTCRVRESQASHRDTSSEKIKSSRAGPRADGSPRGIAKTPPIYLDSPVDLTAKLERALRTHGGPTPAQRARPGAKNHTKWCRDQARRRGCLCGRSHPLDPA